LRNRILETEHSPVGLFQSILPLPGTGGPVNFQKFRDQPIVPLENIIYEHFMLVFSIAGLEVCQCRLPFGRTMCAAGALEVALFPLNQYAG
jgi:hypothetical protein